MIPCPSCGTRNRRGSKYCYRCGQCLDVVFDVSCPACDRLNPGGSAFCAFCGAAIAGSLPATERVGLAQPAQPAREPLAGELGEVEPDASPQRELPAWLYEESLVQPEKIAPSSPASSTSEERPLLEESKYLRDIPGALPKTEGWLSSALQPEVEEGGNQAQPSKSRARTGCLTWVWLALLGGLWLVVMARV